MYAQAPALQSSVVYAQAGGDYYGDVAGAAVADGVADGDGEVHNPDKITQERTWTRISHCSITPKFSLFQHLQIKRFNKN